MQQRVLLAPETVSAEASGRAVGLGKGLVLTLSGGPKGQARLSRQGTFIKAVDLADKVARKLFVVEALELGAQRGRLAEVLGLSRQTLHNDCAIKQHFGLEGLIQGYTLTDSKSRETQRALHADQRPQGNKAAQVAALRAEAREQAAAGAPASLNFSGDANDRATQVAAAEQPFHEPHDWEASRYAGCFVYWVPLISQWHWLRLVMGHCGVGWRILAVFLLMAGCDIRSIEQLKHVRVREAGRILGLGRLPARERLWAWFYEVANQRLAHALLSDYFRYQLRAGLVSGWLWFTDGHLLPYTGHHPVHAGYHTQRRMPMAGRTSQVTTDGAGRIVDFVIEEGKGNLKARLVEVVEKWLPELPARPVIVFDREGFDAEFFGRLVQAHQPFVSWDKNVDTAKLAALDAARYQTHFTFNGKRYSVFEQPKTLTYTPERGTAQTVTLRHIHLWNHASNRRTCALTNAEPGMLSLQEATQAILSRWGASENTFKHLQRRHPWHYHPGFTCVESARQEITNPERKLKDKLIAGLRQALAKLYRKWVKTPAHLNQDGTPRANSQHQRVKARIAQHEAELQRLQAEKKRLPEKVDVSTLQDYRSFKRIDNEGKYLFDFVTTSVWNARQQMVQWLREYYHQENEVVDLFYAITACHGWVRSTAREVTVRLEPLQQPKRRAAQEHFCRKLTSLGAQTPSGKHLVVEVGESPLR